MRVDIWVDKTIKMDVFWQLAHHALSFSRSATTDGNMSNSLKLRKSSKIEGNRRLLIAFGREIGTHGRW